MTEIDDGAKFCTIADSNELAWAEVDDLLVDVLVEPVRLAGEVRMPPGRQHN